MAAPRLWLPDYAICCSPCSARCCICWARYCSISAFAWTAGGGIRKTIPNIPGGMIELSVEYRSAINHTYVIPSEVTSSGATVDWDRTSHNADQVIVRIGTVL